MTSDFPWSPFADRIATATGLAGMLAKGAVRRACDRAGIDLARVGPADLELLLPQLEGVLLLYLPPAEVSVALQRLRSLGEPSP